MEITIHPGTNQIGGSVIEVINCNDRILLDAGLPLESDPKNDLVPPTLNPEGLSAILLTHAHPDHYGLIEQISTSTPIYLTEGTSKALLASSLFAGTRPLPRAITQKVVPMKPFQIGSFTITAIPVDHSAFDAVAYSVQSESKHVLYTGDLRAHGRKPGMLKQLKAYCKDAPVDLLVTEGTRISEERVNPLTETDVEFQYRHIYANAPGLVLNWFSPLNVDRWVSAFRALGQKRYFVHDLYTEFLHYLIKSQVPVTPLEQETQRLRVYCPPNQAKRLTYTGIQNFVKKTNLEIQTDLQEAIRPLEKCVMLFRPSMLKLVFNGGFPMNTELIVSLWPGYAQTDEFRAVGAAIDRCNGKIHYVHASGHIYSQDLVDLIDEIRPKNIIPVHTEHPELFAEKFPQTLLPCDGQALKI